MDADRSPHEGSYASNLPVPYVAHPAAPMPPPVNPGPPQPPPVYGYPVAPMVITASPGNGLAVAGMVLGITSIVFCWWGLISLTQVVLALVFSGVAIGRANRGAPNKGMAVAGLVCGLVGGALYLFVGLMSLGIGFLI